MIIKNYNKNKIKSLEKGKKSTGGRNNIGRITIWHRGGGHKRKYKFIDFKRENKKIFFEVISFHYDPNRSANIALLRQCDEKTTPKLIYILKTVEINIGDKIFNFKEYSTGSVKILKELSVGTFIHNIEQKPFTRFQYVRAAGAFAQIIQKTLKYVVVRLPSGKIFKFLPECRCALGVIGNIHHNQKKKFKAGQNRWLGRRPIVRGVAINPVDHPHGGGEGKSSGGRVSVTPWGKYTKGIKTSKKK